MGTVRDLDVQLEGADAYRADLPVAEQRAIEPLLAEWRQHRDDARVLLMRELDSPGYGRLIDDYVDFVRTEGAAVNQVGAAAPHRVRDTAPSRIWAAYEQVRAYEPVLRWADTPTLHELRIASKWLRYSLEFVQEALGEESAPLVERVTNLQDHLGLMNDADVSASMARTFLVEHASQLSTLESAAIGRYLVNREREVGRLRRGIGRAVAGCGRAAVPARTRTGRRGALGADTSGASRAPARGAGRARLVRHGRRPGSRPRAGSHPRRAPRRPRSGASAPPRSPRRPAGAARASG